MVMDAAWGERGPHEMDAAHPTASPMECPCHYKGWRPEREFWGLRAGQGAVARSVCLTCSCSLRVGFICIASLCSLRMCVRVRTQSHTHPHSVPMLPGAGMHTRPQQDNLQAPSGTLTDRQTNASTLNVHAQRNQHPLEGVLTHARAQRTFCP